VYYRVFEAGGALLAKTAFDGVDPFIGRIKATSVPPPHTVLSLQRALGRWEDHPDHRILIFPFPVDSTPLVSTDKVNILDEGGLGATPATALVLVLLEDLSDSAISRRPEKFSFSTRFTGQWGKRL
jgi:hypothetical protein